MSCIGSRGLILISLPFAGVGVFGWQFGFPLPSIRIYKCRNGFKCRPKFFKVELVVGEVTRPVPPTALRPNTSTSTTNQLTAARRMGLESYGRRTYGELKLHRQKQDAVPLFLNPDHPEDSILRRDLHWDNVFFTDDLHRCQWRSRL